MIRNIEIDRSPITPGERRRLRVEGDAPMTVAINCFTDNPPPPGYKPCAECGHINIQSNQTIDVVADYKFFTKNRGYLDITVRDATGDVKHIRLKVMAEEEPERGNFAGSA